MYCQSATRQGVPRGIRRPHAHPFEFGWQGQTPFALARRHLAADGTPTFGKDKRSLTLQPRASWNGPPLRSGATNLETIGLSCNRSRAAGLGTIPQLPKAGRQTKLAVPAINRDGEGGERRKEERSRGIRIGKEPLRAGSFHRLVRGWRNRCSQKHTKARDGLLGAEAPRSCLLDLRWGSTPFPHGSSDTTTNIGRSTGSSSIPSKFQQTRQDCGQMASRTRTILSPCHQTVSDSSSPGKRPAVSSAFWLGSRKD